MIRSYVVLAPNSLSLAEVRLMAEIALKASDFLKVGVAAAGRGDLQAVEKLLRERPEWLTQVGSHGRTMLWEAAYRGRESVVRYLVARGADVDAWGCHFTPLLVEVSPYVAARFKGHASIAALIEPGKPNPNTIRIALLLLCTTRSRRVRGRRGVKGEAVREVLKRHGVTVDIDRAEGGWPALVFACRGDRGGDVSLVRDLLDAGANVDVVNAKGQTALHCAAKAGSVDIVETLLHAGASVDVADKTGGIRRSRRPSHRRSKINQLSSTSFACSSGRVPIRIGNSARPARHVRALAESAMVA